MAIRCRGNNLFDGLYTGVNIKQIALASRMVRFQHSSMDFFFVCWRGARKVCLPLMKYTCSFLVLLEAISSLA